MIWTILILAVAIALYVFADKVVKVAGKKSPIGASYIRGGVRLVSIIFLIVGINRFGAGTSYYLADVGRNDRHSYFL